MPARVKPRRAPRSCAHQRRADFGEAEFEDFAGFDRAGFREWARFFEARFGGTAFGWLTGFDGAVFARAAEFRAPQGNGAT